ncbi:MAG: ADP-ribosylglycohydrolase family protein [Oscillospiraceae bacterium]|nr:ADP-ribosylglycohydrolase family protein [Oscillospiraceae bacterium]
MATEIKPQYDKLHEYEFYPVNLLTEYQQCIDEGLDIEAYKDVFTSIYYLPNDEVKKQLGDALFEVVCRAKQRENYPYNEPSDLAAIQALRKPHSYTQSAPENMEDNLLGAWMGRICGCMLGKSIEGIRSHELIPFLKETGNYPLHRYILRSDLTDERCAKYKFPLADGVYADEIDGMPADDDTNYTVLYQEIIDKYGRDFTSADVARTWLSSQPKDAYCTAERVAYCNLVNGFAPPQSAIYQNAYREWIGAQIRGDYFGYINPGNPQLAAEMAWRDASISHVKNGIYGEMFVAATLSVAAVTGNIRDIILGGLAQIPHTSRLYEDVISVLTGFENGVSADACFKAIHEKYDEHTSHGWCHTIPNAMIVAAALLYGGGDYARSICMAVQAAFDTDCNAATVGSILGMAYGSAIIPEYWQKPINNTLHTTIFGVGTVKITDRVKLTLKHIE